MALAAYMVQLCKFNCFNKNRLFGRDGYKIIKHFGHLQPVGNGNIRDEVRRSFGS